MLRQTANINTLRWWGALTAGFSLFMALLVLFVIPGGSYLSGFELLILGFLFILGLSGFLAGSILPHKRP